MGNLGEILNENFTDVNYYLHMIQTRDLAQPNISSIFII